MGDSEDLEQFSENRQPRASGATTNCDSHCLAVGLPFPVLPRRVREHLAEALVQFSVGSGSCLTTPPVEAPCVPLVDLTLHWIHSYIDLRYYFSPSQLPKVNVDLEQSGVYIPAPSELPEASIGCIVACSVRMR